MTDASTGRKAHKMSLNLLLEKFSRERNRQGIEEKDNRGQHHPCRAVVWFQ